ncbi:golgin subfamily A member 6-like protein 6 [Monomorium pharaonis]|uniref:golgin subfamily A member 6-like protein 6 n=1 Tax=Monomorium pharaonis TaxID=307658 RepID=UPI0017479D3A|nr:golgin subfamily A member 6-like protein 6 [Monomorium pharaonis]
MAEGVRRERSDSVGSASSTEDQLKRKRELLGRDSLERDRGLADIFKRSKKVMRSSEGKEGGSVEEEVWKTMLKEIRVELGEGLRQLSKEIKEVADNQKEIIKMEIEELKEELKRREECWQKERRELREELKKLERAEEMKKERRNVEEGEEKQKETKGATVMEERVKQMEKLWEGREREERRRNIVIKGLKEKGEDRSGEIKEIMKEIGVEMKKAEGGRIWIEEDLSWEERRIRWKLKQIAAKEGAKEASVWISKGKLRINGVWWWWDEAKEELRDGRGRKWVKREEGVEQIGDKEERGNEGQGKGERKN